MSIDLKVPPVGESITEVEIANWLKSEGEFIEKDQPLVVLETDKATVEIPAPASGRLEKILKNKGDAATVGEVIGRLDATAVDGNKKSAEKEKKDSGNTSFLRKKAEASRASGATSGSAPAAAAPEKQDPGKELEKRVMPAAERLLAEHGLSTAEVSSTGPGGRILKEDVLRTISHREAHREVAPVPDKPGGASPGTGRREETVRMTRLRRTLAERLVQAQKQAALLTTFNEVDMSQVMAMRKEHGEIFREKWGVKLGFMSFFVKAVVDGLKLTPQLNAEIRDDNIVYKNYFDIGVAIGGGKGLVVPILRNAETLSFAEVEKKIGELSARAKENKISIEELQGGTFTISNGGVYGSLLSTPIVNPPQSGVLGMHTIQERPVALNGEVIIRPMMYLALTYDHRIVDGREAVGFLKRVKEVIENPARLLLEI